MTNPQATNPPVVATLQFHGAQLITIKKDEFEFAAMKPIVEGIGMDWAKQSVKLNNDKDKFNCCLMSTVAADGKKRDMLCMPITKLNGWLFSINPNKIPNLKTREKVVSYQEECFIALYDYWHKGIAERKTQLLPETLIPSEQHELTKAVKLRAKGDGKAIAEIWRKIKDHFKVAKYDQLPRTQLHDALNYVEQMEVKSSKQIEQQAPAESLEVGLLKIRVECLEMKNHFLQQHNDCLKMEADTFRLIAKESFAMMRDISAGIVARYRLA